MSISHRTNSKLSLMSKATQWVQRYAPGFNLEAFKIMNGTSYAIVRSLSNKNEIRHIDSHVFMAT